MNERHLSFEPRINYFVSYNSALFDTCQYCRQIKYVSVSYLKFSLNREQIPNKRRTQRFVFVDSVVQEIFRHNCGIIICVKMEVDDEDGPALKQQLDVSKYLISAIQSVVEEQTMTKCENVLNKITNYLTYEDPGMFHKFLIRNERIRQIQDTTAMWLLNQVISCSIMYTQLNR